MRTVRWTLSPTLAILACVVFIASASAQRTIATYSKEAMDNLTRLLDKGAKEGYTFQLNTTLIFGSVLPQGNKTDKEPWIAALIITKADPNKTYRVISAGDNDADDLDLRVLDPAGKIVAQDTTTNRDGEVTFRPDREQNYTIELRLYQSKNRCVCIGAILTK
jgi:hypothetical protein